MSWEWLTLAAMGVVGWYWYAGMQAREQAIAAGRRACGESGVQFLDETVAQIRLRLARDSDGTMGLARHYRFEFSTTGADRHEGHIALLGSRVEWVKLGSEWRAGMAGQGHGGV